MGFFTRLFGRDPEPARVRQLPTPGPTAAELRAAGARIIDVRTRGEFDSGHIANARNIDVDSPGFASALKGLDARYTYVVYCHSGMRADTAVAQMQAAGLTVVDGGSLAEMRGQGWELGR